MPLLINNVFQQVRNRFREKDSARPSAFRLLLRLLSTPFDHGDQGRAFEKLQAFVVPRGTVYSINFAVFKGVDIGGARF